jgi:uncharacterized ion transporter superfamily protein YfcC
MDTEKEKLPPARRGFHVPHTLVLLFGMIVVAWGATLVVPQGRFERTRTPEGKEVVVAGSYARLEEPRPLSPAAILSSVPRGFAASQDIIFFVFIIGGAVAVIRATGAIDGVLGRVLSRFGSRPGLLIAAGMLVFAVGSSTLGMAEEYIPLIPVLLMLCLAMRLDTVTAIGTVVVGYGIGYGVAAINPFTLVVAQNIAELPPTSGLWYRLMLLVPMLAIGFHHVYAYARRVRLAPEQSLVAGLAVPMEAAEPHSYPEFTRTHVAVLALTAGAIALLVVGISRWHWYLEEMGAMFLGLTLVVALVARLGLDPTAKAFAHGAGELTVTALLIGFARAIKIVLDEGVIIDSLIHGLATPLSGLGPELAAVGMLVIQSLLNLFIPSGSGQALVTMPIMAPLADLTHVPRQVAVLAFQFGDGFTNMLVPTNAVLVGILGMAGIPYDRWLRFILPLMAKLWIAAALALVAAVWFGYS